MARFRYLLLLFLLWAPGALAQAPRPPVPPPGPPIGTFSILAYDPETGEIGAAVQSRVFSVGSGVIWAEAGVGAVVTQAIANIGYGPEGLSLLRRGISAGAVVERLWGEDPDPLPASWPKQGRQFAVLDARGNVAAFTGPAALPWAGHRTGRHVSVQGNILAGPAVVNRMLEAFERTPGHLSLRMMAALEAGQAAGGDRRGMQSAAMLVVREHGGAWLNNDIVLRLQVDDDPQPLAELRRLVEKAAQQRSDS